MGCPLILLLYYKLVLAMIHVHTKLEVSTATGIGGAQILNEGHVTRVTPTLGGILSFIGQYLP